MRTGLVWVFQLSQPPTAVWRECCVHIKVIIYKHMFLLFWLDSHWRESWFKNMFLVGLEISMCHHTSWLSHCFFMAKRQCLERSCTQSCAWVEAMIAKASLQSQYHLGWDHADHQNAEKTAILPSNSWFIGRQHPKIMGHGNRTLGSLGIGSFQRLPGIRAPTVTNVLKATAKHAQIGSRAWAKDTHDAVHHNTAREWSGY